MDMLVSIKSDDTKTWFSNLFTCATISMNISSKGPITLSTTPAGVFDRNVLENLGLRAILSAGIGDHNYHDRIFSARITLPKLRENQYEALIYNFVVVEDSEHITLKMNSKALTLLILIYPKSLRNYVNRIEDELELLLSQSSILPKTATELLDKDELEQFINTLRKSIISLENESLLNYEEFIMTTMFDEDTMSIPSQTFLSEFK